MEAYKTQPDDSADYYRGVKAGKGEIYIMRNEAVKLNQAIKDSEEYRHYLCAKEEVMGDRELYQAMNAFRRRNHELQDYNDGINRYQEIHGLALEYEKVLHNPLVNEFLLAEQVLVRAMEDVYEVIADGLELDYGYME